MNSDAKRFQAPVSRPRARGRVLLIGFGNPSRADDGLGPALAARIAALELDGVDVEIDYQLVIEHAEQVGGYNTVIFADADVSITEPCIFRRIHPALDPSFTSHSVSPAAILALAKTCFHKTPEAWLLGMRARDIESFEERLTEDGERSLDAATKRLEEWLAGGHFY